MDCSDAAAEIAELGATNVLIMGGRRQGRVVADLSYDGKQCRDLATDRVPTSSTMGTGAAFSSAMAATLAKGESVPHSAAAAKAYVRKALQNAHALGHGHGPPHHFYRYWRPLKEYRARLARLRHVRPFGGFESPHVSTSARPLRRSAVS